LAPGIVAKFPNSAPNTHSLKPDVLGNTIPDHFADDRKIAIRASLMTDNIVGIGFTNF
jgi:hypothetical protein